ncbi:MAG: 3-hydroxyacyl-CoA dehydrogenase family protein [Myxococcota bacterium]|nr:3-hydroxyacyl-CoA dehydrogenase family protein [Myxococcota bacterium]
MEINDVGVIGAGTMGHGIAQVAAMAGCDVVLFDLDDSSVERGLGHIQRNLEKGVERGKVDASLAEESLARISGTTSLDAVADGADLLVEAVPEKLELKQSLFSSLAELAPKEAIFATNTSSLSIERIASVLANPGRVIGMHFFNPVHIMALLELVVHEGTHPEVVVTAQDFGARIGKEVITVKDFPGFATSRLGVCLGMEAIRMVEQGVASAEDIDKAMVLGYRHPVGPLKLTDMVGLDVRMSIGEYLAAELGNPACEPPELMRQMVSEGSLGKKSGQGFYSW